MKITDHSAGLPAVRDTDMVRIDQMTAIPRWEERTVLHEHRLEVWIDGRAAMTLVCTADELPALVLGHLFSEGYITETEELVAISVDQTGRRADVTTAGGLRGSALSVDDCPPLAPPSWEPRWVYELSRVFQAGAPLYKATHGIHSCFLLRDGEVLYLCEDIGRHNALDKVLGRALLDGVDLSACALFSSGRIPEDMISKVIRTGVPVLISNAVPTDRAVELARRHRVVLITNARPDAMNIYSDKTLW